MTRCGCARIALGMHEPVLELDKIGCDELHSMEERLAGEPQW